jgi:hypothetical protein
MGISSFRYKDRNRSVEKQTFSDQPWVHCDHSLNSQQEDERQRIEDTTSNRNILFVVVVIVSTATKDMTIVFPVFEHNVQSGIPVVEKQTFSHQP